VKTYQIWFINEEVLLIQAEKSYAADNLATFIIGDELVAAFSFDQILGFCNVECIAESEEDGDDL